MSEKTFSANKALTPFNMVAGIILLIGMAITILRFTGGLAAVTNHGRTTDCLRKLSEDLQGHRD